MAWLSGASYLDEVVRDYLTFRGFNNALKSLDSDLKLDKDKGFRVDRIVQHLLSYINTYDIEGLCAYWKHLDSRFFSRFAKSHHTTVKKFEIYLYRLYLVRATQCSKPQQVLDFFDRLGQQLHSVPEWKDWFILPFIQSPDIHPTFSQYFTKTWAESFLISLHNFLASLFSCMPEPEIVRSCIDEGIQMQKLEKENESLKKKLKLSSSQSSISTNEDTDNPGSLPETNSMSNSVPKYIEAMGQPGALVEKVKVTESQPKKNPIFGFVTRQTSISTSPKNSGYLTKQNSQGNDLGLSSNVTSALPMPKTQSKRLASVKEHKNSRFSSYEAQRRELLSSKKKSVASIRAVVASSLNNNSSSNLVPKPESTVQPSIIDPTTFSMPAEIIAGPKLQPDLGSGIKPAENWSTPPERIDSLVGTSTSNENSLLNGDLITYDKNIVLTEASLQKIPNPTSSVPIQSALEDYAFVNNLHKMSVGGQQSLSNASNPNPVHGSPIYHQPTKSAQDAYSAYVEEPFLVLSKDVFLEHHSGISQCRFDSTGLTIASIDKQGVVKVWQNEPRISTLSTVMFQSPIQCLAWCNKPDDILLLGTAKGSVQFFNTTSSFSRDEIAIDDSYPWVTSIATHPSGTSFVCSCVRPSVDTRKFVSANNHGVLMIYKVRGLQAKLDHCLRRRGTSCEITCMEYNHNGNLLVAGDCQGSITLHDMKTYETLHTWHAHHGSVLCLQFSSDETLVFSLGNDGQFLAWNIHQPEKKPLKFTAKFKADSKNPLKPLEDKNLRQGRLFSLDPDGQHILLSCGNRGVIYKINITEQTLSEVLSLPEHKSRVTAVDWTSNKTCGHCLTGSNDGKVQVTTILMQ